MILQKEDFGSINILHGAYPCLLPSTALRYVAILRPYTLPRFVRNVVLKLPFEGASFYMAFLFQQCRKVNRVVVHL